MDLRLYARVIWRFRLIVLVGLLLAIVLSLFSYVRVSFKHGTPSFTYRQAEVWQSTTRLQIGDARGSFGEGRAFGRAPTSTAEIQTADFAGLAVAYKQLANSDAVQRILKRDRSLKGAMFTTYDVDSTTKSPIPVLLISGIAQTPEMARRVAVRGADAFRTYLARRQSRAEPPIPPKQRVKLTVLNAPAGAELLTKRKKTVPIVIFLTVMIAAIGLAFVFENLRPRIRLVESRPEDAEKPRRADSA